MKVTRQTPDQLIISDTPWLIGIMLTLFILVFVGVGILSFADDPWFGLMFGGFGAGLGAVCLAVFVRRVQVILDRAADTLTIRRKSLFRYHSEQHQLSELSHAILEQTKANGGGTMYRATLVFDQGMSAGSHPITTAYSNGSGCAPHCSGDQRMVRSPERRAKALIRQWIQPAACAQHCLTLP